MFSAYDPMWLNLVEIGILVSLPLAAEIGFRAGLRFHDQRDDAFAAQLGIVQATTFAILGLLAAFTMAMAEARFTGRRVLILDEANAIETTYLRSQYLQEPHAAELAPLLRAYVDSRVAFYDSRDDHAATERALGESQRLQDEIWAHAIAVVREDPEHGPTNAQFLASLNEMIDLASARSVALHNHIPATVIGLVVLVGLAACAATGFDCGVEGRRVSLSLLLLPLLVAIALCVIIDLDSPRSGFITSGQWAMTQLQQRLVDSVRPAG